MEEKKFKTIILTGGGTAGHCIPCLALLPLLRKHFERIVYIGSENGIEKKLVSEKNIEYKAIDCVKLIRKPTLKNFKIPFTLIKGINQSKKILSELSPSVVFSKGGYVSLPVAIAAAKLDIPVALHESDLSLGLANKIAANYADVVCAGFKPVAENLHNGVFTGNPLRDELTNRKHSKSTYSKLGLSGEKKVVLVLGGSQGAEKINECIYDALDTLTENFDVLHVTGKGKKRGIKKQGYIAQEYLDDIGSAFAVTDVCVSRAGANALAELTALRIPTVAIPLPKGNSRGDQEENAAYYEKRGAIRVLPEKSLTTKSLMREIELAYKSREFLKNACLKCRHASPNEKIVKEIVKIARNPE